MSIKTLTTHFENKTLPKEMWTHHAHFAVAFVSIDKYKSVILTLQHLRENIKAYNNSVGTENSENSGYHETLAIFWLIEVYEYYTRHPQNNLEEVYESFIKTEFASALFPTKFYSKELLFSTLARQEWVEPDLLSFSEIKNLIISK